jgi:microsomal dipeptidase-like Zn-dependent dipeptidase
VAAVNPTFCGNDGQRACCVLEIPGHGPCADGLYEVQVCAGVGDCTCTGLFPFQASSRCMAAPPCGGDGQRACCVGEVNVEVGPGTTPLAPCQSGVLPAPGCVGDCACNGSALPAIDHCEAVAACGGAGQRGCCLNERQSHPGACEANLVPVLGCADHCLCAGGVGASIDHCEQATSCGGRGQRACCASERPTACDPTLVPVLGCSGDCTCPGLVPEAIQMCSTLAPIAEPDVGQLAVEAPTCALRGYADIHLHLFGDQSSGGAILAGAPYDRTGGINQALRQDFGTSLDLVDSFGLPPASTSLVLDPFSNCPSYLPACGARVWHGHHDPLADTTGTGTRDGAASNLGVPLFNGWPRWTSTTHQQAYFRWLERAWRGGLRLTVVMAVSNEGLCRSSFHRRDLDCGDSMAFVDAQLDTAFDLQDFVDGLSGGPGLGWFRIVQTPSEARDVIRQGKLAVVLGIEVDNLFGCKQDGPCDAASVAAGVARVRQRGVRHLFPIHDFDNAFGGAATWQDGINIGNAISEHHWWHAENCLSEGYGFRLDGPAEATEAALVMATRGVTFPEPIPLAEYLDDASRPFASCNRAGLTPLGQTLINELMDRRMIIDVDHLSRNSLRDTLALTQPRAYPLVAGHVQAFELHTQHFGGTHGRHERMRTPAQLAAIRQSGGLVAAMLKDDVQDTDLKGEKHTVAYGTSVADDCRHSSKTFGQAYQYLVDQMGGPVAFGSDFNGIAGHVGPRFGSQACGLDLRERQAQVVAGSRLEYPFRLPGFGTFDRLVTGEKIFDFNVDGLANVGLLPDLIADLTRQGARQADLDALFASAEAYVALWERVEGGGGAQAGGPCVDRTVEADSTCTAQASIASDALASDPDRSLSQAPAGPYGPGMTAVALTATSRSGCQAPIACAASVTVVDRTPPRLVCPPSQAVECAGPSTPVSYPDPTNLADNCAGVRFEGCTPASSTGLALGATAVACSAVDGAGNRGECTFPVVVEDTTPPRIARLEAIPARLEAEEHHGLRHVRLAVSAADVCDAAPVCRLVSVISSQPRCGRDRPDFVITGPLTVDLRAAITHRGDDDRCGCHDAEDRHGERGQRPQDVTRVYTLTVECVDASSNAARGTTTVTVSREAEAHR